MQGIIVGGVNLYSVIISGGTAKCNVLVSVV